MADSKDRVSKTLGVDKSEIDNMKYVEQWLHRVVGDTNEYLENREKLVESYKEELGYVKDLEHELVILRRAQANRNQWSVEGETKEKALEKELNIERRFTKQLNETMQERIRNANKLSGLPVAAGAPASGQTKDTHKSALKAMQLQLRKTQMEQGASMADVAAEHIAGGGGLGGAVKAAAGLKLGQLKHKFDPLNLVKKITGGSKLLTALAGKVMGRSEKSIRQFADLAPGQELPTSFFGKASKFGGGGSYNQGPSRMSSGSGGGSPEILNLIAANVAKILERLTNMDTSTEKQEKIAQEQLDSQRDANALAGAKKSSSPTRMGKILDKVKVAGGGIGEFFDSLIDKFKLPLLLAIGLLVGAGKMLYDQWDNLKKSFGLLKDSAVDMWEGVKNSFTAAGKWISDKALQFVDTVKDMFDSIVEYVQDVAYKLTGGLVGKKARTGAEKQTDLETAAKAGDTSAQRKLASQNTEKVAAPGESALAAEKFATSFTEKIPEASKGTAAEALKRGDYDAAASASLMGEKAPSGTAEEKATTGAITQLATKAYGEVFKDAQGKPLTPSTDTPVLRATRVPEMIREASKALSKSLSTPQNTPVSPTEIQGAVKETGRSLAASADYQRDAEVAQQAPAGSGSGGSIVNVKNNNVNSTTIHQSMAPARSNESSYLRSLDRGYAPA